MEIQSKQTNYNATRAHAHEYESQIQNLLEKVNILEGQLTKTTEQKSKILNVLKDREEEITVNF